MVTQLQPRQAPPTTDSVLREFGNQFIETFRRMIEQVQTPNVNVAASPAQVAVHPAITVDGMDLDVLTGPLARIERLLTELVTLMAQPTTTKVSRDAKDLITETVTSR